MTTTDTEWALPIDAILARQKARIEGHEDFVPSMVETWHKGQDSPSVMVWISGTDQVSPRDAALRAANVMSIMTGADYVVFTFDSHLTSLPLNPKTGKEWGPGEMQAMCDEEGFCETGQMRDNLVVAVARRSDGKLRLHSIPYHFHQGGLMFYPDDEQVIDEWEHPDSHQMVGGIVPNGLREAITAVPMSQRVIEYGMDPAQLGLEPDKARLHQVMAGVRVLSEAARLHGNPAMYACAISTHDAEGDEIIKDWAERNNLASILIDPAEVGGE